MEELLCGAQRDDVGAVGAALLSDNTIQHAGIVIGLGAHHAAGHTHHLLPKRKENLGYMGAALLCPGCDGGYRRLSAGAQEPV